MRNFNLLGLIGLVAWGGKKFLKGRSEKKINKSAEAQANNYQPVQSSSEVAAGHPIVGAS